MVDNIFDLFVEDVGALALELGALVVEDELLDVRVEEVVIGGVDGDETLLANSDES